jgi:hypothetical protein
MRVLTPTVRRRDMSYLWTAFKTWDQSNRIFTTTSPNRSAAATAAPVQGGAWSRHCCHGRPENQRMALAGAAIREKIFFTGGYWWTPVICRGPGYLRTVSLSGGAAIRGSDPARRSPEPPSAHHKVQVYYRSTRAAACGIRLENDNSREASQEASTLSANFH